MRPGFQELTGEPVCIAFVPVYRNYGGARPAGRLKNVSRTCPPARQVIPLAPPASLSPENSGFSEAKPDGQGSVPGLGQFSVACRLLSIHRDSATEHGEICLCRGILMKPSQKSNFTQRTQS